MRPVLQLPHFIDRETEARGRALVHVTPLAIGPQVCALTSWPGKVGAPKSLRSPPALCRGSLVICRFSRVTNLGVGGVPSGNLPQWSSDRGLLVQSGRGMKDPSELARDPSAATPGVPGCPRRLVRGLRLGFPCSEPGSRDLVRLPRG